METQQLSLKERNYYRLTATGSANAFCLQMLHRISDVLLMTWLKKFSGDFRSKKSLRLKSLLLHIDEYNPDPSDVVWCRVQSTFLMVFKLYRSHPAEGCLSLWIGLSDYSQALSPPQDIDSRLILLLSTLASRDPSFIALSLFLPLVGHLLRTIPLNCSAYSYRFTFSLLPLKCKKVDFGDLRPIETEGNIKDVGLLLYGRAICQSNTSN